MITPSIEILQLSIKAPLRNTRGKIVGVFGISYFLSEHLRNKNRTTINHPKLTINKCYYASSKKYLFQYFLKKLNITQRQAECLYYLVRGKTFKEIGHILAISARTVEDHVEALAIKFKFKSRSEVIEYAIKSGFESFLLDL